VYARATGDAQSCEVTGRPVVRQFEIRVARAGRGPPRFARGGGVHVHHYGQTAQSGGLPVPPVRTESLPGGLLDGLHLVAVELDAQPFVFVLHIDVLRTGVIVGALMPAATKRH